MTDLCLSHVILGVDCKFYRDIEISFLNIMTYLCKIKIRVEFVKKQANYVAHLLAKRTIDHARLKVYHYILSCIYLTIMNEIP